MYDDKGPTANIVIKRRQPHILANALKILGIFQYHLFNYCERFEPRSHFKMTQTQPFESF